MADDVRDVPGVDVRERSAAAPRARARRRPSRRHGRQGAAGRACRIVSWYDAPRIVQCRNTCTSRRLWLVVYIASVADRTIMEPLDTINGDRARA